MLAETEQSLYASGECYGWVLFHGDNFLEKLTFWEIGNIGFNGLAKPIDAFSNVTHVC